MPTRDPAGPGGASGSVLGTVWGGLGGYIKLWLCMMGSPRPPQWCLGVGGPMGQGGSSHPLPVLQQQNSPTRGMEGTPEGQGGPGPPWGTGQGGPWVSPCHLRVMDPRHPKDDQDSCPQDVQVSCRGTGTCAGICATGRPWPLRGRQGWGAQLGHRACGVGTALVVSVGQEGVVLWFVPLSPPAALATRGAGPAPPHRLCWGPSGPQSHRTVGFGKDL